MLHMGRCMGAHSAPMRMPLAATRGAPTKDATPAPPATASVSFTLCSHIHSFAQHEDFPPLYITYCGPVLPTGCHFNGSMRMLQRQALFRPPHDAMQVAGMEPGIFMGIFHDGDFIVGALQAALQEGKDPWGMRAGLAQPCAAP